MEEEKKKMLTSEGSLQNLERLENLLQFHRWSVLGQAFPPFFIICPHTCLNVPYAYTSYQYKSSPISYS